MTITAPHRAHQSLVRCTHCPGIISVDGQPVHDHHPSCTYWSLRCRICQTPITGRNALAPRHNEHNELCFMCGDHLEVESHP